MMSDGPTDRSRRGTGGLLVACAVFFVMAVSVTLGGCAAPSVAPDEGRTPGESTGTVGRSMAGAVVDVNVTPEAVASRPETAVLDSPESAVRAYLAWTSYAYRIGQSRHAASTMTSYEEVRVDSYLQFNLQKYRLIDQNLTSIDFGKPVIEGDHATITADEAWTYRYVSIQVAGKTVGGPYTANYEATYTLVKTDAGAWVVDSVEAKALGEVK